MNRTELEAICQSCPKRQRPCVKSCLCGMDGLDVSVHVTSGICPLGWIRKASKKPVVSNAVEKQRRGVGTELSKLLAWWGFKADVGCSCKSRARYMDRAGVVWCEQNKEVILDWLEEEAKRRGMWFVRSLARCTVLLAIYRARQYENGSATSRRS